MTKKRYTNALLAQVRAELAREPWSSGPEIADRLGISRTAARKWLTVLVRRGSAVRVEGFKQHRFALNRDARRGDDTRA